MSRGPGPAVPPVRSEPPAVTAVILAGGRSSRFGGDKLAAELGGRSVLEATLAAVREVADEIIVVGRSGAAAGVAYVGDERPFEGPLAGLLTGLRTATTSTVLVVGGDMPALEPGVLRLLVRRVGGAGSTGPRVGGVVLEEAGSLRPLPLAARRGPALAAAEAGLASGDRSLRGFLVRLAATAIAEPEWRAVDPRGDSLLDVDTPADLARVQARMEPRG